MSFNLSFGLICKINGRVIGIHFEICFFNVERHIVNKQKERTGPRTDPWGTPALVGCIDDLKLFSTMHCFLFVRKDATQFNVVRSNLYVSSSVVE